MKAISRQGPGRVALVDKPLPDPGVGQALVQVEATGICGSDIHRFTEDNAKWDRLTLGHEFSGTVAALGPPVPEGQNGSCPGADVKPGSRVTAAPLLPCHACDFCARGEFSLCEHYSFTGSRVDGSFAEFVTVPVANLVPLGEDFPLERGAFVEPVTVCLHPILRLGNLLGKTVVVTGLGAIGLLAVQIFRAMGARIIVAVDIVQEKLDLAARLGATHSIRPEDLDGLCGSFSGAHVVFESSGANPAKIAAVRVTRGRGSILLVGTSPRDISFDAALFERITRKELNIVGSWMNYSAPWPGEEWSTAVWMLREGLVQTDDLVTQRFALQDFQKALEALLDTSQLTVKIMINPREGRP